MFCYCLYLSMNLRHFFGDNPILTLCIPLKFAALSAALLWKNFQIHSLVVHLISRKFLFIGLLIHCIVDVDKECISILCCY
jgi:hypothetical protein